MANHHFDEDHVEELLRSMPKITDDRNAEEIYRSVQMKLNNKQKSKKLYMIPALTILAAAILFVLISPVFLHQGHQESKSMDMLNRKDMESKSVSKPQAKIEKSQQAAKENVFSKSVNDQINKSAVYEQDITGNNVFTYGVLTQDAVVVPVSVVTPKVGTDWAAQYKKTAETISTKLKYLDNYLPLHGDITYDPASKKVHVKIAKSTIPSITEQIQLNIDRIVQYSFAYQDVKEVDFTDENGNPIEIGEIGSVTSKTINKTPHTAFYLYRSGNGEEYLLPTDDKYPNIQAALVAMKTKPDDFHLPVIQPDINIKVIEDSTNHATIQFENNMNLDNAKNPMNMIEAILLTAKNFGFDSVHFENIEPLQWDGFDFSKPVNVPIAPNRINVE